MGSCKGDKPSISPSLDFDGGGGNQNMKKEKMWQKLIFLKLIYCSILYTKEMF
jgi:hypothetical protein